MKKNKGIKTTVVALIGMLCFIASLIMLFTGHIDKDDFQIIGPSIIAFFTFLGLNFAKDSDKSHTRD